MDTPISSVIVSAHSFAICSLIEARLEQSAVVPKQAEFALLYRSRRIYRRSEGV
jgi:hypothetical protein